MTTNNSNDKNVYIIGAGFSKEIGLPLQDDFLLRAKEVYFRNTNKYKHFENVFKYQNELAKMRNFLSYPLLNLEHLFNLLEMDIFYSNKEEVQSIKDDFVRMIKDVFIELTPNPFEHNPRGVLKENEAYSNYFKFLNMFVSHRNQQGYVFNQDTIISFNYDVVIEASAAVYNWKRLNANTVTRTLEGIQFNVMHDKDNFTIESLSKQFIDSMDESFFKTGNICSNSDNAIKLIKLHGSTNWLDSSKNLFLVPPTWNKSDKKVSKLWNIAYSELKNAKRIIIIGYSFPETDIYVKSLLALALNENKILQSIYFVNPDKAQVKDRCHSLLDDHFKKYCDYKEWTFSEFIDSEDGVLFIKDKLERNISSP